MIHIYSCSTLYRFPSHKYLWNWVTITQGFYTVRQLLWGKGSLLFKMSLKVQKKEGKLDPSCSALSSL